MWVRIPPAAFDEVRNRQASGGAPRSRRPQCIANRLHRGDPALNGTRLAPGSASASVSVSVSVSGGYSGLKFAS
jgi:hypothetical protein